MTEAIFRELKNAPSTLSLYGRALLRSGGGKTLPSGGIRMTDVIVDSGRLRDYRNVCGFSGGDHLPVTYPHILAFPLHMELMVSKAFPFKLLGLVHISNRITQFRPIGVREQMDIECRFGALQDHEKGKTFSIITSVTTAGELVWESESTMLHRTGGGSGGDKKKPEPLTPWESAEEWSIPANIGRRYARVSGDSNPIHLYPLTAKLFGFPRHIAHGMWSKARILAALESEYPKGPFTVDVQFKLPVLLPAKVRFDRRLQGTTLEFRMLDKSGTKPHLTGELFPADGN